MSPCDQVTMGGYAGSEGETTEMSSYFDADASVRHLLAKGIPTERMVVHGLSIGGGLASAAAVMHPGISCTVDQTFVSAREVAEVTSKMISKRVPTFAIEKVVNTCFPQGKADPRLPITTDAYDNLNKAAQIQGMYFVMWGEDDAMMPPAFAERLFQAHYTAVQKEAQEDKATMPAKRVRDLLFKLGMEWPDIKDASEDAQREMLARIAPEVDLESLAAKKTCRIAHGEHGCFFGDDPTSTRIYESYLRGMGFVRELFSPPDEEIRW